jgi:protein SCO1/2
MSDSMFFPPLLTLSLLAHPTKDPAADSRLAVIQKAPRWVLIDQNGKEVRSSDFDRTVLLVSFVFTTCSGSCPATTARMSKIQETLRTRGYLKNGRVRLLSITLDPARDTPKKLQIYSEIYDADPKCWSFLTGPRDKVAQVIAGFGMWARIAAKGQLDHPSRIFLVDGQRRVREIYNLSFLKPAWVAEDIELLLKEETAAK